MAMRGLWRTAAGALTVVVLLAGCGSDDDEVATDESVPEEPTEQEQAAGGAQAYCDAARALDEQEGFPTPEQLDELAETAPEEIRADVEFVAERFKAAIEAGDPAGAFADPEVEQRLEPIEAFEVQECGLDEAEEEEEQDPSVTELDPAAARVDVIATEYAFELDPPAAGPTSFVMDNQGDETHVMLVARLAEGATLDQALQADDPAEFIEEEYESDVAAPGGEAVLTTELTPGEWAMICFLPAPDGEPHFAKGMAESFSIEEAAS